MKRWLGLILAVPVAAAVAAGVVRFCMQCFDWAVHHGYPWDDHPSGYSWAIGLVVFGGVVFVWVFAWWKRRRG